MILDRKKMAWLAVAVLVAVNGLVWLCQVSSWWPAQIAAFLGLILVPGFFLLAALRVSFGSWPEKIVFGFGLGILTFLAGGLLVNGIPRLFGFEQSLTLANVWIGWSIWTAACAAGAIAARRTFTLQVVRPRLPSVIFVGLTLLLPVLAAFGAFRLNSGGDGLFGMIALGAIATSFIAVVALRKRLPDASIAWWVFIAGLSILLMTSLRSWDITGHDLAREFHVFTLTHQLGYWDASAYRDPYNACLSITIFPEFLSQLLNVSGLVIFKFVLQVVFAVCPVVVYLLLRRYGSKLAALSGVGLFLSYPTFINDSAMLTRQGIAYLFFALAMYVAFQKPTAKVPKLLFILLSAGVIVSHYSTSYMFVGIFAFGLLAKWLLSRLQKQPVAFNANPRTVLSPLILAVLALMTFAWYTQITATSGNLAGTLKDSIMNIPEFLSDDNKSVDTSAALFLSSNKTLSDIYDSYMKDSTKEDAAIAPEYTPHITSDVIPVTAFGDFLRDKGVDLSLTTDLRQFFAKFLQVLALLGVGYAVYRVLRAPARFPLDLACISAASIVLLGLIVVMPTISINYGVLRAFQQALIFLIVPMTLLLAYVLRRTSERLRSSLALTSILGIFLLFSGFIAQLIGGTSPSLTLNNQGIYHGLYYTTSADLRSYEWMKAQIGKKQDVRAASFARAIMHDPEYPFRQVGILPTQKPEDGYVYLDQAQMLRQKFYVYYDSSPLVMTFPLAYYETHANQIYSTGSTGVFR